MNRAIVIYITCLMVMATLDISAQENTESDDEFEARILAIKNPFISEIKKERERIAREKQEVKDREAREEQERIEAAEKARQEELERLAEIERRKQLLEAGLSSEATEEKTESLLPEMIEEIKPPPPLPEVEVSGIIWNSDRPQVIINQRIVDINDEIFGIKITEITKEDVKGLYHGKSVTIKQKGVNYD